MATQSVQTNGNFFDSWGIFSKNAKEWLPGISTVVGLSNILHAQAKSSMPTATKIGSVTHSVIALIPGVGNLICLLADIIISAVRHIFDSNNIQKHFSCNPSEPTIQLAQTLIHQSNIIMGEEDTLGDYILRCHPLLFSQIRVYKIMAADFSRWLIIDLQKSKCQTWVGKKMDSSNLERVIRTVLGSTEKSDLVEFESVMERHSNLRLKLPIGTALKTHLLNESYNVEVDFEFSQTY